MKGFVCVGVLYLPKSFASGGWGFSIFCFTASATVTTYCAGLLLECQTKLDCKSYADIGEKCYGKAGKAIVNTAIAAS